MMNQKAKEALIVAANQRIKEKNYWLARLSGDLVKTGFPYDFKTTCSKADRDSVTFKWTNPLYSRLTALSSGSDRALHIILLAGLVLLLNKYSGNRDIVIGTPIYKQDIEENFINTVLVLRHRLQDNMTFKDLLLHARETFTEADENQNYPIEVLITQLNIPVNDEFPLFDIAILLENIHDRDYLRDIHLNMIFSFLRTDECITGKLEYNPLLYRSASIKQIIAHFKHLLREALSGMDVKVSELDLLTDEMKKQLLIGFNDTAVSYPKNSPLHRLFKEQAEKTPDRVALTSQIPNACGGNISITYRELNNRSDHLAKVLIEKGVQLETIVAVTLERSVEMIVGLLGILKGGGAYMPIDPDYPEERIDYMLADSGAKVLVTAGLLAEEGERVRRWEGEEIFLEPDCCPGRGEVSSPVSRQDVLLTSSFAPTSSTLTSTSTCQVSSTNLAYIIYTSGSTGNPKGVMVVHRNVLRLVKNTNYVELNQETRILQTGAPVFDATTFEIWGSLLNGGRLVLVENDVILNAHRLGTVLTKNRINTLWLSSPLFNQLMEQSSGIFSGLTYLLVGGDVLSPRYINRVRKKNKKLKVINGYGPTENTTFSTYYLIDEDFQDQVPIGWPISNSSAYVLDDNGCLQPPRVWGELWVGGDGVARGYMNRPELTSEKFINDKPGITNKAHPSALTVNTLYRTGDVVRWSPQGTIEFAGRKDNQVKIRGYRVETGEIETLLLKHDQIKEAVVMVKEEETGKTVSNGTADKYLCAYVVTEREVLTSELREYLSGKLPPYMIPSYFVQLENLPLSPNGKVDRKALPKPGPGSSKKNYTAPRNPIEEKLADIWSKVLKVQNVGVYDDFFELGGHSLKVLKLLNALEKELQVRVNIRDIYAYPTIAGQYELVTRQDRAAPPVIPVQPRRPAYELSYAQKRLWMIYKMEPHNPAYNLGGCATLLETVDEDIIRKVIDTLVQRHESFRTRFKEIKQEAVQIIEDAVEVNIETVDLSHAGEKEWETTLGKLQWEERMTPFCLEQEPLWRVKLLKRHDRHYELLFIMHHIITDGWSMEFLTREFMLLYESYRAGKAPDLEPLEIQYKDYAAWHNQLLLDEEKVKKTKEFWENYLKGKLPVLNLPYDITNPPRSTTSAAFQWGVPGKLAGALQEVASANQSSLFMVLLAGFNILLSQVCGQKDIILAVPAAARQHESLKNVIGMFVNTLVLRTLVDASKTFTEFFNGFRSDTFQVLEYQDYPMELIFSELKIKYPEISVFFNMVNLQDTSRESIDRLEARHIESVQDTKFDIHCYLTEYKNGIKISCHYFKERFLQGTIEKIANLYMKVLENIVNNPSKKIFEYSFTGKKKILKRKI